MIQKLISSLCKKKKKKSVHTVHAKLLQKVFNLLQYPKGLGETVPELKEKLKEGQARFSKTKFTMLIPEVISQLESNHAIQHIVLFGIEVIH